MQTAEDIIGQVGQLPPGDTLTLPVLTGIDLCVLGAMNQTLVEREIWSWWTGRSDADRFAAAGKCKARLAERGLVIHDGAGPQPVAALGIIAAARTRPLFIVVCKPPKARESGGPVAELRCYGVGDESYGLRAVLVEQKLSDAKAPLNAGFRYFLCQAGEAARQLAAWACEPPDRKGLGSRKASRQIEVYRPGRGGVPERLEIAHGKHQTTVTSPDGNTSTCPGEPVLAEQIAGLLTGGQR